MDFVIDHVFYTNYQRMTHLLLKGFWNDLRCRPLLLFLSVPYCYYYYNNNGNQRVGRKIPLFSRKWDDRINRKNRRDTPLFPSTLIKVKSWPLPSSSGLVYRLVLINLVLKWQRVTIPVVTLGPERWRTGHEPRFCIGRCLNGEVKNSPVKCSL